MFSAVKLKKKKKGKLTLALKSSKHLVNCFRVAHASFFPLLPPTVSFLPRGCSRYRAPICYKNPLVVDNEAAEQHVRAAGTRAVLWDVWLGSTVAVTATASALGQWGADQVLAYSIQCHLAVFPPFLQAEPRGICSLPCSIPYLPSSLVLTCKVSSGGLPSVNLFLAVLSHFGFPTVRHVDEQKEGWAENEETDCWLSFLCQREGLTSAGGQRLV